MDSEKKHLYDEHYEEDLQKLLKDENQFGNTNYYLKRQEYIKKNLWKNAKQVDDDLTKIIKGRFRGY